MAVWVVGVLYQMCLAVVVLMSMGGSCEEALTIICTCITSASALTAELGSCRAPTSAKRLQHQAPSAIAVHPTDNNSRLVDDQSIFVTANPAN